MTPDQRAAIIAALEILRAAGISVRIDHYWRAGERCAHIVMLNVEVDDE